MAKRIVFSDHARDQLIERHITKESVALCVARPDKTTIQPSGRIRVTRRLARAGKAHVLVVVYEETRLTLLIITTFVASKIKKYL